MPTKTDIFNQPYNSALNTANFEKFYVGTTPQDPVVEQNQTYMAYFDGVGGTGPELIDQTAYFIKYLIDTKGNVVNPEPANNIVDPQGVPLYNLVDNFEPGKRAIVRLIGNDPLLTENPNDDSLTGIHNITHVGRIVPILVTETGENKQNYVTTMSFGPLSTQTVDVTVPNVTAYFRYSGNEYDIDEFTPSNIDFDQTLNPISPAWTSVSAQTKRIESSSLQTGTRIRMKVDLYLEPTWTDIFATNRVGIRILQNGNPISWNANTSGLSPISRNMVGPVGSEFVNDFIRYNEGGVYTSGWSPSFNYNEDDIFVVQANVLDDNPLRTIKVKGVAAGRNQSVLYIGQETPPGTGTGATASFLADINITTASYWEGGNNFPALNGGYSVLLMSPGLTNMWQSGLTQNLPTASAAMNFSPIAIPFSDISPGDFIRFEYKKDQVYTIYNIQEINSYNGDDTGLAITIAPALTNLTSSISVPYTPGSYPIELNHFVIYRVINDGTYVVLDVPKPVAGNSFAGIIQPEFISKELVDNYDKIIVDLTQKEIIN